MGITLPLQRDLATTTRVRRNDPRGRAVAIALVLTVLGDRFGMGLGHLPAILVEYGPGGGLVAGSALVLVASVVLAQLGYAAVGVGYLRRWGGGVAVSRPTRAEWLWIGGGTIGALVLSYALLTGFELGGVEPASQPIADVRSPSVVLALGLVSVLLIGPAEELLYRGAIQGRLRRAFGPAVAIGLASVLFAAVHVTTLRGSPAGTLAALAAFVVLAAVFGLAYERTGNLAVPMLVHGLYDATIFAISYAALA